MRKKILLLSVFVLCSGIAHSMRLPDMNPGHMFQMVEFDDDGEEPPTEDPPPPAPINSYVYLLLALGVSLGYVVLRRTRPAISHPARAGEIFNNKKDTSYE